jgi:hypothetical protein
MAKEPTIVTPASAQTAQTLNASARVNIPVENVYAIILAHGKDREGVFGSVVNFRVERDDDGDVLSIGDSKNAYKGWSGDMDDGMPSFLKSITALKSMFGPKRPMYSFIKGLDVSEVKDSNAMHVVGLVIKHPK